jgi:hypothetical protein
MATLAPKAAVVAIVTTESEEISTACVTSMLRLQQQAAQHGNALTVTIVPSFLEALNSNLNGAEYLFVVNGNVGVPPEFFFGVFASGHDAVAGVYPLPKIDWTRVTRVLADEDASEPLAHAGNVYNLTPVAGRTLRRYVPVKNVQELRVVAISSKALESVVADAYGEHGEHKLYAHDSVIDGKLHNPYQTFAHKLDAQVCATLVADLEAPCSLSAPASLRDASATGGTFADFHAFSILMDEILSFQ